MAYSPDTITIDGIAFEPYISAEEIQSRVEAMAHELCEKYRDHDLMLISVLRGAFIFTADFYRNFELNVPVSFLRASSYDGLVSTGNVQFSGIDVNDIVGKDILILEDIVDTGNTLSALCPRLLEHGASSVGICSLLLKPDELKHELPDLTVGFEIPSRFVVGYGLDYNEKGRNLSGIYIRN